MNAFKVITVTTADPATLNRIQQNVADKFREDDAPVPLPVLEVQSSTSIASYTVTPSDQWIVVNSRGGPIKIVLPAPNRATQAVRILNAFVSNKVSIVQSDGKAMGNALAELVLDGDTSATMVCTGRAWYRFGPA